MRISDWSSDVCSSDLFRGISQVAGLGPEHPLDATEKAGGAWDISDRARRRQCLEPSLSPHRARQGTLHSHYGALPVGREWLLRAGRETISDDRSQTGKAARAS